MAVALFALRGEGGRRMAVKMLADQPFQNANLTHIRFIECKANATDRPRGEGKTGAGGLMS